MSDMENEKIFIIVPVYKVEAYLDRCITSILNQTYQGWELVLVDDGSPDNCPAICDRYAAEHDNITVIHQENGGVSAARNTAVTYTREHADENRDWITFIDSDDFVHPNYLEYLHRAATEANTDISGCAYLETSNFKEAGFSDFPALKFDRLAAETYWCTKHMEATVTWGKLYRLILFHNITFPVGFIAEDQLTSHKLIFQRTHIAFVPVRLYFYFTRENSIMHSVWTPQMLDELTAKKEHAVFFLNHGYSAAHALAVRELFLCCIKHLRYMENLAPKYNHLKKEVHTKCRQAFHLYAHHNGYIRAMLFWYNARIVRPIRRVLSNESVFSFLLRKSKQKMGLK